MEAKKIWEGKTLVEIKRAENLLWLIVILLLIAAYVIGAIAYAKPTEWRGKMGELSSALSATIPYLYPDPGQDTKGLTERVKKICDITKQLDSGLNHSIVLPDGDPALPYIANLFRRDMEQAYDSLESGHAEYAKGVIRSSIAYCMACHTRTQSGAEFPLLKAFEQPLKKASWIDQISFQAATRQFDTVLTDVMSKLSQSRPANMNALDLERASRIALSIAVRVKKDPTRARFLAQAVLKSPAASDYMKNAATQWIKDIGKWQSEEKREYTSDKFLVDKANALLKDDSPEELSLALHREVNLLRASNLMHDLLRRFPNSSYVPEALYTIGLSYISIQDLGLWSLHEMYFQACIEKAPHTVLAEKCYKEYETSTIIGYSGSSGTHIPGSVSRHLARMKGMATVKNTTK